MLKRVSFVTDRNRIGVMAEVCRFCHTTQSYTVAYVLYRVASDNLGDSSIEVEAVCS